VEPVIYFVENKYQEFRNSSLIALQNCFKHFSITNELDHFSTKKYLQYWR